MVKRYQNPIIMFEAGAWSEKAQLRFMKFNIFANKVLPVWLLHKLNASSASVQYKKKMKIKEERLRQKGSK